LQDPQSLKPYKTVGENGESEIVISKSRFLGYCRPVHSEAEAAETLAAIRKQHWDARHVCYAFRIADGQSGISRSSDDGEPSGTAGVPILNVLLHAEAEDALCAVVRYFGGVLLGTGGLVRAYGKAASLALQSAGLYDMRVCQTIEVVASYPGYALLEPLLRKTGVAFEVEFTENVKLTCTVPAEDADAFSAMVTDKTDGGAEIRRLGQSLCAL